MNTSIVVRPKNTPHGPLITALPETVDLDAFDVVDEHGNLVGKDVLDEIKKLQAGQPEPASASAKGKTPVAPPVTHTPVHEPAKKK